MYSKTKIKPISKETISIKEKKNGLLSKISISDFRSGNMIDLLMTTDKVDHPGKILIMEEVHVKITTTMDIKCRINMKDTVKIRIKVTKTKVIKIIVHSSKIKIDLTIPNKSLIIRMLKTTNHEKKVFKDLILKISMVRDTQVIIMDPFPHKNFYIAVRVIHHQENSTTIVSKVQIMITESINKYKDLLENIFMIHNRVMGMVQVIIPIKLKKIHTDKVYV
jgi:hypothetical protein